MRRTLLLVAALLALPLAPAAAQDRWVVRTEPGTPVVAVEVLVAAGPADEDTAQAGVAYLAARTVVEPIRHALDSLGARLTLQAHKDALSFTLTAAPDAWEDAARVLLVALFRDPPAPAEIERQRRVVLAELRAREANPADALGRETDRALFGERHPWGRPAVGSAATVQRLSTQQVDDFLRTTVVPERALLALVGPVRRASADALFTPFFPPGPLPVAEPMPPTPADSVLRRDYNSITTWIAAVYPFPASADVEALGMLADAAAEMLEFSAARRSVYDVRAEVLARRGGGELRLQMVVPPEEAEAWAQRMRGVVASFADPSPAASARFREQLRHYRGVRLLSLETPEARARELARQYLRTGLASIILTLVDGLTGDRLAAASRALPEPLVVFLGPFYETPQGKAAP